MTAGRTGSSLNNFEYRSSTTTAARSSDAKPASRYHSFPPMMVATRSARLLRSSPGDVSWPLGEVVDAVDQNVVADRTSLAGFGVGRIGGIVHERERGLFGGPLEDDPKCRILPFPFRSRCGPASRLG